MIEPDPKATWREQLQAVGLALVCSILFLREALLPGRALVPFSPQLHDVRLLEAEARGTLDRAAISSGHVGMGDKYFQSLCWDRVLQDRLALGEVPRWTRDIAGGAPMVAQMAQPYHPSNLLLLGIPCEQWYGFTFLLQQVLFGWSAYAFFRRSRCRHAAAMFGLVLATLGLWLQCRVHHNVVVSAALPIWLMLQACHRLTEPGVATRRGDVVWLALATALSWLSGFASVSLQATYLALAFAAVRIARLPAGQRRTSAIAIGAAMLLALGMSLVNMAPILLAYVDSARRQVFDEALLAASGLEWAHLLTSFWPDLLSQANDHIYPAPAGATASEWLLRPPWSQLVLLARPVHALDGSSHQVWVETSYSIGAAGGLCAVLAWAGPRHRAAASCWFVVAALAFGFSMAAPPFVAVSRYVPGLQAGDLRRCLFSVAMALTVLATFGADALLEGRRRPALLWPALGLASLSAAALGWLWLHAQPESFVPAMARLYAGDAAPAVAEEVRRAAAPGEVAHNVACLSRTLLRTLLVASALVGAALLAGRHRLRVLLVVAAAELLHVGLGPVRTVPAELVQKAPAVLQPVLAATAEAKAAGQARPRLARCMPANSRLDQGLPGNFPGYLGLEDLSFYSALAPQRALEFATAIEPDRPGKNPIAYRSAGVGALHEAASLAHPLLDLFGVRFVLSATPLPTSATFVDRTPAVTGGFRLYERLTTLPLATFVTAVDVLPDRAQRLAELQRTDRDVAHRVVLEEVEAPRPAPSGGTATVDLVDLRDERVVVRLACESDGYLRLADPYDAGWRVTVDGQPARLWIADHYLRAVHVAPGPHEIVFTYDGPRVDWPLRLSLMALAVTLALLLSAARRR